MDKAWVVPPRVLPQPYPAVHDFKAVISTEVLKQHGDKRAIDVLKGPFESLTNLPYRALAYLYKNEGKPVLRSEVQQKMAEAGYDYEHIKHTIYEWLPNDLRVAVWREKDETWMQWVTQTEEELAQRKDDREWFNSLPE